MAVNIGYSIGWGDIAEPTVGCRVFSTFYVVIGASFVGLALGVFADKVVEDHDHWFDNAQQKEAFEKVWESDANVCSKFWAFMVYEREQVRAVGMWLGWIALMVIYSCWSIGWAFNEGLYFAIASCSTGGHWSIPEEHSHKDWLYFITGVFSAIGVPLMGIAMGSIAGFLVSSGDVDHAKDAICAAVTKEELDMLQEYNLIDDDGIIEKSEFVVLCMVRTGVDPKLIGLIVERFNELDVDGQGDLSLEEILEASQKLAEEEEREEAENAAKAELQDVTE